MTLLWATLNLIWRAHYIVEGNLYEGWPLKSIKVIY